MIVVVLAKMAHKEKRLDGVGELERTNEAILCLEFHVNFPAYYIRVPIFVVGIIEKTQHN